MVSRKKIKYIIKIAYGIKHYIGFVVANLCSSKDQKKLINMLIVSVSKKIFFD